MALIVEDGNGLVDAESYVSTADLAAYFTKWGLTGLSATASNNEVLLRKATRAVDALYSFIGGQLTTEQALAWPRVGDGAPEGVPGDLVAGTCEMAYIYLSKDPLAPLAAGDTGLTEKTVEVGDLKKTLKWMDGAYSGADVQDVRKVTLVLQDLLASGGGLMMEVVRG